MEVINDYIIVFGTGMSAEEVPEDEQITEYHNSSDSESIADRLLELQKQKDNYIFIVHHGIIPTEQQVLVKFAGETMCLSPDKWNDIKQSAESHYEFIKEINNGKSLEVYQEELLEKRRKSYQNELHPMQVKD